MQKLDIQADKLKRVVITGGTGFLGNHLVKTFLDDGNYRVITTTTNIFDQVKLEGLKALLRDDYQKFIDSRVLQIEQLDVLNIQQLEHVTAGCDIFVHSACPTPLGVIKNAKEQQDMEKIILQGMKNVLQVIRSQNVKRLVLTSSTTCVIDKVKILGVKSTVNEDDWADENVAENIYTKMKVLQEKLAWQEYRKGGFEMVVINPGNMLGPSYKRELFASAYGIRTIIEWSKIPGFGFPKVYGQFVDVRDVAKAHLFAVQKPEANGRRFLIVSEGMWTVDIAKTLASEFGKYYKIRDVRLKFPIVIHLLAPFSPRVHSLKTRLGPKVDCDTTASKEVLGLEYRPIRKTLIEMFYTMIEAGLVENQLPKNYNMPKL